MLHGLRFEGGYERNFPTLHRDTTEYEGEDGTMCRMAPWPDGVNGVRYSFMEQPGKRFVVVRVRYGDQEVLLHHPVRLDPARHLGGKRFSAQVITVGDRPAGELLGNILDANPDEKGELMALRDRVREDMHAAPAPARAAPAPHEDRPGA
jgi:hypothetical protein